MTRNRKAYPQVSEASKSEDSPSPKRRKKRNARKRPKPIVLCECLRDTNEGNDDVDKIKCMQDDSATDKLQTEAMTDNESESEVSDFHSSDDSDDDWFF